MKKLSIITPCHNDADTLELYIESVLDQDYKEKELIIIDDGSTDNSRKIIKKFEKQGKLKGIYFDKNQGACKARNAGAKIALGDVYSFLPADSFVKPGAFRYWMEKLDEYPQHGFIYGGYAFVDNEIKKPTWLGGQIKLNYFAQAFNARDLETANYIDGSFPLRKEVFWGAAERVGLKDGLWNPEVKSLQDWDFWLSVVKDYGATGLFANSIFFETTMPHAGGLSYDSAKNWKARVKQIQSLHNIREREICVTSLGAPFHGRSVAEILDADYKDYPAAKPHDYKMIYEIGFFANNFIDSVAAFVKPEHVQSMYQMMSRGETPVFFGGRKVVHFIGTDVWMLRSLSGDDLVMLRDFLNKCEGVLCEIPEIQKELKAFGIKATVVPFPPKKWYDITPLPKKKAVAVYLPKINEDFYFRKLFLGFEGKKGLAHRMKDVDFYFFGNPQEVKEEGHLHFMGHTDKIGEIIDKTNAIIRITAHDGLPISVAEWIGAGRNAVATVKVPHSDHFNLEKFVKQYGKGFTMEQLEVELEKAIRAAIKKPLNTKGAKYYRRWLDHKKYKKTMETYLKYDEKNYWENRAGQWNAQMRDNDMAVDIQLPKIKPYIQKIKGKKVLDIGCGEGRWSPVFKDWEYEGCDISSNLIQFAKENYPDKKFFTSGIRELPKKVKGKYDLLFLYTVLLHVTPEHWEETVAALKKIGKKMILIEPIHVDTADYCFNHDYKKSFKVIQKKQIDPWRNLWYCDLS